MVNLEVSKKNDAGVKRQLVNLIRDIGIETLGEVKELGKEVVRGVTMLDTAPINSKNPDQKSWADEWLKDNDPSKPPVSEKMGEHSKLDVESKLKQEEQRDLRQVQNNLRQMYSKVSPDSSYGQKLAQDRQNENKPIYDKLWQEREEKSQAGLRQQSTNVPIMTQKRKRGDWRGGVKKKKAPTPQELGRSEYSKGQH